MNLLAHVYSTTVAVRCGATVQAVNLSVKIFKMRWKTTILQTESAYYGGSWLIRIKFGHFQLSCIIRLGQRLGETLKLPRLSRV